MAQLYSRANDVRDIYRQCRHLTKSMVKAGKIKPEQAQSTFRAMVIPKLQSGGHSIPKSWSIHAPAKQGASTVSGATKVTRLRGKGAAGAATVSARVLTASAKAAALGLIIDGSIATVDAVSGYRAGRLTGAQALKHVLKEALTGAAATGTGTLVTGFVAIATGGTMLPFALVVGAGTTVATKEGLSRLISPSGRKPHKSPKK